MDQVLISVVKHLKVASALIFSTYGRSLKVIYKIWPVELWIFSLLNHAGYGFIPVVFNKILQTVIQKDGHRDHLYL